MTLMLQLTEFLYYKYAFFKYLFINLLTPQGIQDLSSPIRD